MQFNYLEWFVFPVLISLPFPGKRNYRNGDLRDKLDRRLSPERRHSPRRDARDQQTLRGYSPLRSIDKKRNQKKK
ncbi:zinc finger CCCH domain-containing protein 13-like [Hibiscus syriacus]|uniref:zinc finger CCCH domain-containing protein 13-like n=1 Tax=Hibiscus syriacus TaxID=106335 RepID=UPI001921E423|nr:zinc finger CCCH domain-containing protein 13-like [Hibiscus syriacus]